MYVINFGGSTGISYRQCVHEDKRTLVLPSQLMDFLRVIDKHTKNLPQLSVLTIVLTE